MDVWTDTLMSMINKSNYIILKLASGLIIIYSLQVSNAL